MQMYRSSTLALALKGIEYDYKGVHLVKDGGEQVGVTSL